MRIPPGPDRRNRHPWTRIRCRRPSDSEYGVQTKHRAVRRAIGGEDGGARSTSGSGNPMPYSYYYEGWSESANGPRSSSKKDPCRVRLHRHPPSPPLLLLHHPDKRNPPPPSTHSRQSRLGGYGWMRWDRRRRAGQAGSAPEPEADVPFVVVSRRYRVRVYRLCDDCFDSGPRSFPRSPLSSSLSLRPSLISLCEE